MTARAWLEAIACILLAIYLMTSIQAAYLNNKIAARNHNRVTDLHGEMELGDLLSRSRVDNPSTASGTAGTTDAMDTSSNTRDITRPERAMVSYDRRAEAGEERPYKNPFTGPQQ
ncbi:hypothetical protein CC78DRAFT_533531 [Lojkania enalia]|uniref:Secreted protein n=1 Tax=Lojkania enalia TaxID=147567 RepID=A0A9P4K8K4_9PLEO|nr:hypothetical protein CC78DRAFT_533531 [Didymosphaeria enalia]